MVATTAALELGALSLEDALALTAFYGRHAPERFEPAARRWLARLVEERRPLREIADAADALLALGEGDESAVGELEGIARRS